MFGDAEGDEVADFMLHFDAGEDEDADDVTPDDFAFHFGTDETGDEEPAVKPPTLGEEAAPVSHRLVDAADFQRDTCGLSEDPVAGEDDDAEAPHLPVDVRCGPDDGFLVLILARWSCTAFSSAAFFAFSAASARARSCSTARAFAAASARAFSTSLACAAFSCSN